jgi:hypothetical protein
VQPLLNASHIAAYLLDPLHAVCNEAEGNCTDAQLPMVPAKYVDMAKALMKRVGGAAAVKEFEILSLLGYFGRECDKVAVCADNEVTSVRVGHKRSRQAVAPVAMRKAVWKKYLVERYPVLSYVACRLLSLHATSAATQRNWSLWG